jgi:hypothetical protein
MKNTSVILAALMALAAFAPLAHSVPLEINRRDAKFPTQAMLEHQTITTPIVATTNQIKTTYAGPTSAAAVTLTSFTAQPDVPRNITITPTGTTGDVESCVITVTGTNYFDASISENLTFAANDSTAQATAKAFKTVTSVAWPADCESGGFAATWIIGVGDVLGLKRCMDKAGHVAFAVFDGAYEATRPTCVADADEIEKNTCDINGTLNGAKDVELFFVQNFRCFP